jgi:hypothetical protein
MLAERASACPKATEPTAIQMEGEPTNIAHLPFFILSEHVISVCGRHESRADKGGRGLGTREKARAGPAMSGPARKGGGGGTV